MSELGEDPTYASPTYPRFTVYNKKIPQNHNLIECNCKQIREHSSYYCQMENNTRHLCLYYAVVPWLIEIGEISAVFIDFIFYWFIFFFSTVSFLITDMATLKLYSILAVTAVLFFTIQNVDGGNVIFGTKNTLP